MIIDPDDNLSVYEELDAYSEELNYFLRAVVIGINLQYVRDEKILGLYRRKIEELLKIFPDDERLQHKYKVLIDNYFH